MLRKYRSKGYIFHLTYTRDSAWLTSSKSHRQKSRHDINEIVNYTKEELYDRFAKKHADDSDTVDECYQANTCCDG